MEAQTAPHRSRLVPPNYGPYGNEADALAALVKRLVAALDPDDMVVWLPRAGRCAAR